MSVFGGDRAVQGASLKPVCDHEVSRAGDLQKKSPLGAFLMRYPAGIFLCLDSGCNPNL